ncbi:hypothetical protein Cs7R123_54100 [Catellatospora sp. TT07R-123]|uniref:hypothetical protein n=1 Tax=Catellatospora sp. TT07R-123 TaxID=2733863 RepID=UPI001B25F498|nr:hypothetical protein [Catellatospora sp. TT07R-123]GHJ48068.1 hypothetical protein Cs7R123_54100 [Catellatospora sp. TT07R-123]
MELRDGQVAARAAVLAALRGTDRPLINVFGPLGVGKTLMLTGLDTGDAVVVDGVDDADAVMRLARTVSAAPAADRWIALSRRPLPAWPDWPDGEPPVTVRLDPWRSASIESLAREAGLRQPAELRAVASLSGGLPLVAGQLSRALLSGVPADARGALAAPAAREVLRRLATEGPAAADEALTALATLGCADEEMLARLVGATAAEFDRLAELSVVRRDEIGLALREPYRTLLDLGARWRRPLARQSLLAGGVQHRMRQAATRRDRREQVGIVGPSLALVDDPVIRETLFPAAEPRVRIRPAEPGDEADIVRLTRHWARRGHLDAKACGRMLETWWACQPTGFYLAVGPEGEALGLSNVLPLRESATPALELLLQQHTGALRADPDGTGGVLVGLAVSGDDDPAVHAAILRHTLAVGMAAERVLVSTPWLPYQRLCEQLGMVHQGDTRHDVYRCGRMNRIYLQDFAVEALPSWLGRLGAGGPGTSFDWERYVRQALADLHRPGRLATSPLSALPVTGSGTALAGLLRAAVELLGGSGAAQDVEAAQALTWRYLHSGVGEPVRLGRSRATYFRRLRHGVRRVTEIVQALAGEGVGPQPR